MTDWTIVLGLVWVVSCLAGCGHDGADTGTPTESVTRIGVYDSRAIAVAFVGSEAFKTAMAALEAQHAEAKAAGDEQRVAELEAQGAAQQERLHQQGFATVPVDDILTHVADQLPAIKAGASVETIVSKWDQAALSTYPTAERVDVTMALVDALAPTDRQRERAIEIQKVDPTPVETAKIVDTQGDRWARIVAHYEKIEAGMTQQEVRDILGQPDQSHSLFEPKMHNPRRIGSSWFYMKEPKPESQRGDTEIVVRFDTSGKVTRVDSWGLSP